MTTHLSDPTLRFSNRAGDYIRYRPGYPEGVLGVLSGKGTGPSIVTEKHKRKISVESNPGFTKFTMEKSKKAKTQKK